MAKDHDFSRESLEGTQEDLDQALSQLKEISDGLSKETNLIMFATIFNTSLAILAAAGAVVIKMHALDGILLPLLSFALVVPLAWVTYTLWKFDRMYRSGYELMQELSDIVEHSSRMNRKNLKVRDAFHTFLASSTLPFYRGGSSKDNYAPLIYFVANISMFMFAAILLVIAQKQ